MATFVALTGCDARETPVPNGSSQPTSSQQSASYHAAKPAAPQEEPSLLAASKDQPTPNELSFEKVPLAFGVTRDPQRSQSALVKGRRKAAKGDWKAAASAFEEAVATHPEDATARGELGYALQQLGDDAAHLLRSAETLAASDRVRAQIVHNLARGYEMTRQPLLAERAKHRAQRLRAEPASDSAAANNSRAHNACPVVITVQPDPPISFLDWRSVYRAVVQDQQQEWGLPPGTEEEARAQLCQKVESSPRASNGERSGTPCEIGSAWSLFTDYGPRGQTFHQLWPLKGGKVGYASRTQIGTQGTACDEAAHSEASRVGALLVLSEMDTMPFPPQAKLDISACAKLANILTVTLHDADLNRTFTIEGLDSDVSLRMRPEEHAVQVRGRFCDQVISLRNGQLGSCEPTSER